MISLDEALAVVDGFAAPLGSETIPLAQAHGRYLARDIRARSAAPERAVSTRDGYAVCLAASDPSRRFRVIGAARAGAPFDGSVGPFEAVRIFTGAVVPAGADCVIMQEYADLRAEEVVFAEGFGPDRHIRAAASDFEEDAVLVPAGRQLDAKAMVAAAAADRESVVVGQKPRVAILATGDELVLPGSAKGRIGAIPDSASFGIAAMASDNGALVVRREILPDRLPVLIEAASRALSNCDLVVVVGGASVGEHDFAKPMFAPHGLDLAFSGVAMKPGKPVWLGRAQGVAVLGLPGNPTSAMVTAALFMKPLLARLQGGRGVHLWRRMPLAAPLDPVGSRETLFRASWEPDGLRPLANQDSGVQALLASADWLIRRSPRSPALRRGDMVEALRF